MEVIMIPERTKYSIDLYVQEGIMPGGFLQAVLSNDLFEAFGRADEENTKAMKEIISYIYNKTPMSCWGNKHKIKAWIEQGGLKLTKNN
jgi:hypothetical protein